MKRRTLRMVNGKYMWFIGNVPYGNMKFSTKREARAYLERTDKRWH